MRSELIIFGLQDTGENCPTIVKKFFKDMLELQEPPEIVKAYWKGKGDNKPAIVQLTAPTQKRINFLKSICA